MTTKEGKCDVTINWFAPSSGNSPILKYKLLLKGEPLDMCTGHHTFCVIQMKELVKAPFNLKENDLVSVSVIAVNAVGESVASEPNSEGAMIA